MKKKRNTRKKVHPDRKSFEQWTVAGNGNNPKHGVFNWAVSSETDCLVTITTSTTCPACNQPIMKKYTFDN